MGNSILSSEYICHFEIIWTYPAVPDKAQLNCHSHTKINVIHFLDNGLSGILRSDRLTAT